jgi:hypothetical protein
MVVKVDAFFLSGVNLVDLTNGKADAFLRLQASG